MSRLDIDRVALAAGRTLPSFSEGIAMIGAGKVALVALGLMADGGRAPDPGGVPIDPPRSATPVLVYPPGSSEPIVPGETATPAQKPAAATSPPAPSQPLP